MELIKLDQYFNNLNTIYAHITNNKENETLEQHLETTYKYFTKLIEVKNLDKIFSNIINKLTDDKENRKLLLELIHNCIYLHDIGKINPAFQAKLLSDKKLIEEYNRKAYNSNHSLLSSLIFIDIFNKKIDRKNKIAKVVLMLLAYVISKHHGRLDDSKNLNDFIDKVSELQKENVDYCNGHYTLGSNKFKINTKILEEYNFEFYILGKLIFALLTGSDFYATNEYMNDLKIENFGTVTPEFFNDYTKGKIYTGIQNYKKDNTFFQGSINGLRSDIFLEAEENLKDNIKNNIFYLEAPTGSGKTNTSINLARTLVENDELINKIFYIFPFNTLIEQTGNVLKDTFSFKNFNKIGFINSITAIKEINNEDPTKNNEVNYELSLLYKQFLNYPIVLTSHVSLFSYLFGTGRQESFPLINMCNSVVIIDEVQTYNNTIWKQIITMFEKYSVLLNIKFIVMSATLPQLSLLSDYKETRITNLLKDPSVYYTNSYFKDRVRCDFSLLDNKYKDKEPADLEKLADDIIEKIENRETETCKVLIEFITKRNCNEFASIIKNKTNLEVITITGADNKFKRENKINKIKSIDNIIICATQVIEAGVDIDVDLGFKNISILESEEQFLGRINRSCKKRNCVCYFFNLYPAIKLYKEDIRVNLLNSHIKSCLKTKDFTKYFNDVFNGILKKQNKINGTNTPWDNFILNLSSLNYTQIKIIMELINSSQETLFIPLRVPFSELPNNVINNYKELCTCKEDGFVDGEKVFNSYKDITYSHNISYAEKIVKLSKLKEIMLCFTFGTFLKQEELENSNIVTRINGMYYVKNIDNYMENGELKFEQLLSNIKSGLSEEDLFI